MTPRAAALPRSTPAVRKSSRGQIRSVRADAGQLTLVLADPRDENNKMELTVAVPPHLKIIFNGDVLPNVRPVTLADLQADDRVVVRHIGAGRDTRPPH